MLDAGFQRLIERFPLDAATLAFIARKPFMFIDGQSVTGRGPLLPVHEPSSTGQFAAVFEATSQEIDAAVTAAHRTSRHPAWRWMKPNDRFRVMLRIADLMEAEADILAQIETLDSGKPISACRVVDILGSADLVRFMASLALDSRGEVRPLSADGNVTGFTLEEPAGVIACIVPWNFPLNTTIWKVAAPMAAGCTMVVKPDHNTSLSTLYFAELCKRAGLPDGVLNILTGRGATVGSELIAHPLVDRVSFTGSTATGRQVGETTGRLLKPTTLELGGKSPMVAFADADVLALAEGARNSVFFNAGQVCSAGSRIYAARAIFDDVVAAVSAVTKSIVIGPGLDETSEMGPVTTADHQARVRGFVERARSDGSSILTGAQAPDDTGWYVEPTIILPRSQSAECVQEEIFGPVVTIMPFDSDEEAVRLANDSQYALAASIWTRDLNRVMGLSRRIEAGTVWVNCHDVGDSAMPFGGNKASGHGKDLGREQFRECLSVKSIIVSS